MRIGELSRETGVAVPTIKFYVREGLLPPGRLTSPNQASYDQDHVRRLRLIRGLIDVGGLSVAAVREVLSAVDAPGVPVHKVLGAAHDAITPVPATRPEGLPEARQAVAELIARRGWRVGPDHPAAEAMAVALAAFRDLGQGAFVEVFDDYAAACERIAGADLAYVGRHAEVDALVESVVVGTVLGDAVLTAMRRLAHVDRSARRYERDGDGDEGAADGAGPETARGGAGSP
ncbi:MerR family transcriptional regulator [Streptomyces sp. NRRL F-4489]|uniref:MerR family transcriptional regulator n=1 Tax=Streptomyces sp. NRRL F-4489 TaxID=1609095 RepID=UPI00074B167E|nr:MerR family transcriptional regulator [Streptomyces sp. NRRL F-4489]KUL49046.1 MerR family transcriptional regulator [Streptomyces sp. NRRL F-4489]